MKCGLTYMGYELQLIVGGKIDGTSSIRRKSKSWLKNIRDWTNTIGNNLIHAAQNRDQFAVMVAKGNRDGTKSKGLRRFQPVNDDYFLCFPNASRVQILFQLKFGAITSLANNNIGIIVYSQSHLVSFVGTYF